jgi:hypothetical protein
MTFRTFEEWFAIAFPWLRLDCRDALNMRAAWDAGQQAADLAKATRDAQ